VRGRAGTHDGGGHLSKGLVISIVEINYFVISGKHMPKGSNEEGIMQKLSAEFKMPILEITPIKGGKIIEQAKRRGVDRGSSKPDIQDGITGTFGKMTYTKDQQQKEKQRRSGEGQERSFEYKISSRPGEGDWTEQGKDLYCCHVNIKGKGLTGI